MQYTRMYTGPDGLTHFQDIEVELTGGRGGSVSEVLSTTGMMFRRTMPDYDLDWHPAPRRYFVIIIEGSVRIEGSGGETRVFGPGSMHLAEDTTGKGHKSHAVDGQQRLSVYVNLADDQQAPGLS